VRGRSAAVEQSRLGKHESTGAQRGHPGATPMRRTDGVDQRPRWRFGNIPTGGNDHCPGTGQRLQAAIKAGRQPPADLGVVLTADSEVVPGGGQAPVDAEDLARQGEFEQRRAVYDSQRN